MGGDPPPAAVGEKTECLGGSEAAADGETEEQSARESGKGSHTLSFDFIFSYDMPMIRVYIYMNVIILLCRREEKKRDSTAYSTAETGSA